MVNTIITAGVATGGFLLFAAAMLHDNHISYDLRWMIDIPLALFGWILIAMLTGWTDRTRGMVLLAIAAAVAVELLRIDHLNLLVEHDL